MGVVTQFKEVFLTPRYLGIAMEYAGGGDMFEFFVRNKVGIVLCLRALREAAIAMRQ